jgi:tRNA dimethylallyltransferase
MQDISARGKIPLLVGGTMLYYKALQEGLSTLPSADEAIRQTLEQEAADHGWLTLHERLQKVDPEAASRIHPNDPQRISRALEVYMLTGQPMTKLWEQQKASRLDYRLIKLIFFPENRQHLHERIEQRFRKMIEQGFIEEVEQLKKYEHVSMDMPSMRSVGYRQVLEYLDGQYDLPEMIDKGIFATRQLAKRQITWLRKEEKGNFYDPETIKVDELLQNLKISLSL